MLGWEDPLQEGMATHSGILSQKISWTEEPDGLQSMGPQRVRLSTYVHIYSLDNLYTLDNYIHLIIYMHRASQVAQW